MKYSHCITCEYVNIFVFVTHTWPLGLCVLSVMSEILNYLAILCSVIGGDWKTLSVVRASEDEWQDDRQCMPFTAPLTSFHAFYARWSRDNDRLQWLSVITWLADSDTVHDDAQVLTSIVTVVLTHLATAAADNRTNRIVMVFFCRRIKLRSFRYKQNRSECTQRTK